MDKKVTIGNVCFIENPSTDSLLLLHRDREPMKGMYTGVGGKTRFEEDLHSSCLREVKEETGLDVDNLTLKGVVKTILDGKDSSWILFVYTAQTTSTELCDCDEGTLTWVPHNDLDSYTLIGFIEAIFEHILDKQSFFEATIVHDMTGKVLDKRLTLKKEPAFAV